MTTDKHYRGHRVEVAVCAFKGDETEETETLQIFGVVSLNTKPGEPEWRITLFKPNGWSGRTAMHEPMSSPWDYREYDDEVFLEMVAELGNPHGISAKVRTKKVRSRELGIAMIA